jgi:hypothetical protein
VENEQKEMLISKLKSQVNDLSAYKETAAAMKAQICALENHVQERELEIRKKNDEINIKEKW